MDLTPNATLEATSLTTKAEFECLCTHIEKSSSPYILEIGTSRGGTSGMLAGRFPDRWIWTIDKAALARNRLSEIPNLVRLLGHSLNFGSALKAMPLCPSFALVFIDASHLYPDVKADFQCWSKFVADDGHIAFHDAHVIEGGAATMDGTVWDGDRAGPRRTVSEAIADGWQQVAVADSVVVLSKG